MNKDVLFLYRLTITYMKLSQYFEICLNLVPTCMTNELYLGSKQKKITKSSCSDSRSKTNYVQ